MITVQRRAERFDSTRQLDLFADLTLGPSDDERDEEDTTALADGPEIVREGIASFAPLLPPAVASAVAVPQANTSESIPPEQENDVQTNGTSGVHGVSSLSTEGSAIGGAVSDEDEQVNNKHLSID